MSALRSSRAVSVGLEKGRQGNAGADEKVSQLKIPVRPWAH
jgi:hypothetical protein